MFSSGGGADGKKIPESAFCAMLENPEGFPLWEFSTCVFFVVPMAIIMVLYIRMGLQIRSRTKHTTALGKDMDLTILFTWSIGVN